MKKIVIAGGTGFIGQYLAEKFQALGYEIVIISRQQGISWNNPQAIITALENAAALINLAGKSVNCRYNSANKREILLSRTDTTKKLGEAIQKCERPPALWINSSTATIYRHAEDRPMTEDNGEIGRGFSVDVATAWEAAFFSCRLPHTRQVALRMAIVLGEGGGVMRPFVNLVRFGLGGRQGTGKQMFSWIHIEDLLGIIVFVMNQETLNGVFNCAAPNPITNDELMTALRRVFHKRIGLPSPVWLLKVGAVMIGTETELLLKSRWVVPAKLLEAGYQFRFPTIEAAFKAIVNKPQSTTRSEPGRNF